EGGVPALWSALTSKRRRPRPPHTNRRKRKAGGSDRLLRSPRPARPDSGQHLLWHLTQELEGEMHLRDPHPSDVGARRDRAQPLALVLQGGAHVGREIDGDEAAHARASPPAQR